MNNLKYYPLVQNKIVEAISIVQFNLNGFQKSAKTYKREVYLKNKQYALAKLNYQKSLDLNPENNNTKKMLAEIVKSN